jgi:hypothetical protein
MFKLISLQDSTKRRPDSKRGGRDESDQQSFSEFELSGIALILLATFTHRFPRESYLYYTNFAETVDDTVSMAFRLGWIA